MIRSANSQERLEECSVVCPRRRSIFLMNLEVSDFASDGLNPKLKSRSNGLESYSCDQTRLTNW